MKKIDVNALANNDNLVTNSSLENLGSLGIFSYDVGHDTILNNGLRVTDNIKLGGRNTGRGWV